ncbi:MAG: PLxRFG domain-containing protein [Gammaproteobacteria bacterium]
MSDVGATASDFGKAVAAGAAGIVETAGFGLRKLGAEQVGGAIEDTGREAAEWWRGRMSEGGKAAAAAPLVTDDLSLGPTPFSTIGLSAAESLPGTVAMAVPGLGLARGLQALKAGEAVTKVLGGGRIAQKIGGAVAPGLGFGTAEGVFSGAQNAAQIGHQIREAPDEQLAKAPFFQEALARTDAGLPLAERMALAREETARSAENEVFGRTALTTGGISAVTGGGAFSQLLNPSGGVVKRTLTGAGREALQEAPQSGTEKLHENLATREHLDATRRPGEGVVNATALGAASGGLLGAATGAVSPGAAPPLPPPPAPGAGAAPPLGTGPNAGPTPGAPPPNPPPDLSNPLPAPPPLSGAGEEGSGLGRGGQEGDVGLGDLDPAQQRHIRDILGEGLPAPAGRAGSPPPNPPPDLSNSLPAPPPLRGAGEEGRGLGREGQEGAAGENPALETSKTLREQMVERARADLAAEQARVAELAARGPLSRAAGLVAPPVDTQVDSPGLPPPNLPPSQGGGQGEGAAAQSDLLSSTAAPPLGRRPANKGEEVDAVFGDLAAGAREKSHERVVQLVSEGKEVSFGNNPKTRELAIEAARRSADLNLRENADGTVTAIGARDRATGAWAGQAPPPTATPSLAQETPADAGVSASGPSIGAAGTTTRAAAAAPESLLSATAAPALGEGPAEHKGEARAPTDVLPQEDGRSADLLARDAEILDQAAHQAATSPQNDLAEPRDLAQPKKLEPGRDATVRGADQPRNLPQGKAVSEKTLSTANVPLHGTEDLAPPTSDLKGTRQGAVPDAETARDVGRRDTLVKQGFGALDVPGQARVLESVLPLIHDDKVFRIQTIPVDVVHKLVGKEVSPKDLLHDKAMFVHALATNNDLAVRGAAVDAIVRSPAFPVAEVLGERALPSRRDDATARETPEIHAAHPLSPSALPTIARPRRGRDARLEDPGMQAALRYMAMQAGWAQRGGEQLRDEKDQVIGRTKWLPKEPWYAAIPERLNPQATIEAVRKAIAGEKLGAKERRVVGYMLDALDGMREAGALSPEEREVELARRQEEEEAEREAREEREAIMAEAEMAVAALPDEDIDVFIADEVQSGGQGSGSEAAEGGRRALETDTAGAVGSDTPRGTEARLDRDAPLLEAYSAEELAAREQRQLDAERRAAEQEAAAKRKREADRARGDFRLTGSDLEADELAARGQKSLLDQPAGNQLSSKQPVETAGDRSQAPPPSQQSDQATSPLRIEDLTEKSIIVRGDTETHKNRIKALRGLWNRKRGGWVFPKKREAQVRAGLNDLLESVSWVPIRPNGETVTAPERKTDQITYQGRTISASPPSQQSDQVTSPPETPTPPAFVPREGWETNMWKARDYAQALGIEVGRKRLATLVAEINAKVAPPEKPTPEPSQKEAAESDFEKPRYLGQDSEGNHIVSAERKDNAYRLEERAPTRAEAMAKLEESIQRESSKPAVVEQPAEPASKTPAGPGVEEAVDAALDEAFKSNWIWPIREATPTLAEKFKRLADLDVKVLDEPVSRRAVPHNEYFRTLQGIWLDVEAMQREADPYAKESIERSLANLERKAVKLIGPLQMENAKAAFFYAKQLPALIAAVRERLGTEGGITSGPLSEADLSALFDEAAAEVAAEGPPKTPTKRPLPAKSTPKGPPQAKLREKTAADIAKEAAKLGVKGIDETLKGLAELFGGGRIQSFPAGFDAEAYAKAKPHFEAALEAFQAAGKTLKDLFKFLIHNFGAGIKPYAVHFAREKGLGLDAKEKSDGGLPIHGEAAPQGQPAERAEADEADREPGSVPGRDPGGFRSQGSRSGTQDDEGLAGGTAVSGAGAGRRDGEARDPGVPDRRAPGAARAGGKRGGSGRDAEREARAGAPGEGASDPGVLSPGNYRITEADALGQGGAKTKARQNLEAIRVLKRLAAESRPATAEEQAALVKYVGWGDSALANNVFPLGSRFNTGWEDIGRDLQELLSREEYAAARASTLNAHYTSKTIIQGIYGALKRLGFAGGRILEPGSGIGHFIGLLPSEWSAQSRFTGVELDTTSAAIASHLYPKSDIRQQGFEAFKMPKGYFDLALGNPPFDSTIIQSDPEYANRRFSLHDYFIAKSLDRVRPGGLLALVTSHYSLDKGRDAMRTYVQGQADLLGAIRLPKTAFMANAGTEVVTDVLFLRKRLPGEEPGGEAWGEITPIQTPDGEAYINEYFAAHPELVLGEHALSGSMYSGNEYTVEPRPGEDLARAIEAAADRLPANAYRPTTHETPPEAARIVDVDPRKAKEGAYYLGPEGELLLREEGAGHLVAVKEKGKGEGISEKHAEIIRRFVPLRDAALRVLQVQIEGRDDAAIEAAQAELTSAYEAFIKQHGFINTIQVYARKGKDGVDGETERHPILDAFKGDPDAYRVASLEVLDEERKTWQRAPIFSERVIAPHREPAVESVEDALHVSLYRHGAVDLGEIGRLAGMSEAEAFEALGTVVYEDPVTQAIETADAYLSGNVRQKLAAAREAARNDPRYERNVAALEAVQPADLPPSRIALALGQPILETAEIEAFGRELGLPIRVTEFNGAWGVEQDGWGVKSNLAATSEWGTSRYNGIELIDAALNSRTVKVYDTIVEDGKDRQVLNQEETVKAQEKLQRIKQRFAEWAWEEPARAERLARAYNDHYNHTVKRDYGGPHIEKMSFPGLSAKLTPRPHQKRVAWRIVQSGNTYMAHSVGAGKTIGSIVAGMELKRLGIKKKPAYVVPNHMLKQFAVEFYDLYPAAKILVADEEQFAAVNRKRFMGRVANENWDAVIITHSAFGMIPMSPDFQADFIQRQIDELAQFLLAAAGDRMKVKLIERQKKRLEQRLAKLISGERKDKGVHFEETGIDMLFVDEAQAYRKIDFITNQTGIKGIDPNGSVRGSDLYLKSRYIESLSPGRSLVLMSGTPITNTLAEVYSIQRLLQGPLLEAMGIHHFDAWAASFGDYATNLEATPGGSYQAVTRFAKFKNLTALSQIWGEVGDTVFAKDLHYIERPKVRGGGRELVIGEQTETQENYRRLLAERIKDIKARRGPPQKGDDIILSVITDGQYAALDPRFVDPEGPPVPDSKVEILIDRVHAIWQESKPERSAQMIFNDLGLPGNAEGRGFSTYAYIRDELVRRGMPRGEIAFMQDYKKSADKKKLFESVNAGRVRVLIGSSEAMGTGVNAQKRLIALHHLDPDRYLPSNIEQREGRIVRQGNTNPEVQIAAYVTRGSFDETMWQFLETKQRFIEQFLRGDAGVDEATDVDGMADQFALARAMSSDNPLALELAGLEGDIQRLSTLKRAHLDDQAKLRSALVRLKAQIPAVERRIGDIETTIQKRTDTKGDKFRMTVSKAGHSDRAEAATAIVAALKKEARALLKSKEREASGDLGVLGGLPLTYSIETRAKEITGQGGRAQFELAVRASLFLEGQGGVRAFGPVIQDLQAITDEPGHSMVTGLEHTARGFDGMLTREREDLARLRHELDGAENRVGRPFEHEDSLAGKQRRAEEIRAELAKGDEKTTPEPEAGAEDSGVRYSRASAPGFGQRSGLFDQPAVRVIQLTGLPFPNAKAALRYALDRLRGSYRNRDTGWDISVARAGLEKALSHSGRPSNLHLNAVRALPGLLDHAVLAESKPDAEGDPNIRAIHRFYAPLRVGKSLYRVKLTVKETTLGKKFYDQSLTEIETANVQLVGEDQSPQDAQSTRTATGPLAARVSIPDLLRGAVRDSDGQPFAPEDGRRYSYLGERAAKVPRHALAAARASAEQGIPMEAIRKTTGWFKPRDGKWRFEISDAEATLRHGLEYQQAKTVGEALDHKTLFENYPQLADVRIVWRKHLPADVGGGYDPSRNVIHLNATRLPRQILSTLLHELQHLVQYMEGFARGGSPEDAAFISAAATMGIDVSNREAVISAYARLMGEVEARDVQARANLSAEELRERPPYISQGIPESDFIVRREGDFAAEVGPPLDGRPRGAQSQQRNQKPGPAGLSVSVGVLDVLTGRFGAGVGRLFESKTLRIVQHESELPPRLNDGKGGIRGVYDPKTDITWMVADNLSAADAPGVFLHELGVHFGLERMVGSEKYQDIIAEVKRMEAAGDPAVLAARKAIPKGTREAAMDDELLAYLVEKHPELPLVKRILAAIRAFLFRKGLIKKIRPEDVVALARAAAKHAARAPTLPSPARQGREKGGAPAYSGSPLWYSEMAKFIDAKAPGKAPAGQWKMLLAGWAKAGKFKGDELEWSGVQEWLDLRPGPVTKGEVLDFVRAQPGFDISPELRASAMRGLPLFARAQDQTQTPEFKRWFGGSKVVDEKGRPLRLVHHGDIPGGIFSNVADQQRAGVTPRKVLEWGLLGHWFSEHAQESYGPNRVDAYLSIKNPLYAGRDRKDPITLEQFRTVILMMDGNLTKDLGFEAQRLGIKLTADLRIISSKDIAKLHSSVTQGRQYRGPYTWYDLIYEYTDWAFADRIPGNDSRDSRADRGLGNIDIRLRLTNAVKSMGYDGYLAHDGAWVAFESNQIKSATDNSGAFDATNPDIRYSRVPVGGDVFGHYSDLEDLRRKVRDYAQREYVFRPKIEVVRATKEQVIIPWQGVKHTIAGARDEATLKTVNVLPELVSNSRHTKTEPDREGRRNIKAVHEYQADAAIDGQSYRVLIVVREHLDGKRFYDHVAIAEKDEPAGISGERQSVSSDESLQPAAGSSSTIAADGGPVKDQGPLYSRGTPPEGTPPDPGTPEGSAAAVDRIGDAMRATRHGWDGIKSKVLEDWRPAWLGLFTRRQLVDIGQGMVPALADYDRAVQAMDADRSQFDDQAHEVAEAAAAYVRANRKEADQLFDLMHSATLAGVDPADRFRASINRQEAFEEMASLRRRMRGRSGEADVLQARIDQILTRLGNEKVRKAAHPGLARRYWALSQEAKVVYAKMRDLYKKRFDEREEALIQRIRDAEADERWKARLIADIRARFETARLSAPYFPLTRFGDYWVAATNPHGEREFHLRESTHQQKALLEELQRGGYQQIAHGYKMDSLFEQQGASAGFVSNVIKLLDKGMRNTPGAAAIKDDIYQMYLQTLPELSARKNWIHRQKTPGFSKDALRSFARQMFHGNRQLARLRRQTAMEKALAAARKQVSDAADPNRAAQLVNEMQKRDEWIKNPTTATWANVAGSVGFLWYLTAPAAALVNTSQTPLVAYPLLATRHGWGKAAAALSRAAADYFKGGFTVEAALQGEELAAFRRFLADGLIDKTQSHDLAGMSETPSGIYSGRAAKIMRAASYLFHRAERMNREVTALAAFRLGRAEGLGFEAAYEQAKALTWESHFDYSNSNKARFIQGDVARVLWMFKQFSQHMTYLLARSAHQSMKGMSPQIRSEARKRLTGLLGMHALFAGALGMPLMGTLAMVMNALFDDEDEPYDFETEFRNFLAEAFGPGWGQAIAKGPVESITGLGISPRVGLSDLWFREPDRTLEGRGLVEYWTEQLLGPLGGIALKAGTGYEMFQEGHTARALESMTPGPIRDGLRMLRYAGDGVQSLRGDPVMEDVSTWNLLWQGAGFSPAELAQKYDANRALKDIERRILNRRENLINRWWLARRTGDQEGVREAMDAIRRFNVSPILRENPRARITPATLLASTQQRRNYSRRAEGGIIVDQRLSRLPERVQFVPVPP